MKAFEMLCLELLHSMIKDLCDDNDDDDDDDI